MTHVEILRCPISHSNLRRLNAEELAALNVGIRAGTLRHMDGTSVERQLTAALESVVGGFVYRVEDGIYFLLASTTLCRNSPSGHLACHQLPPETASVKRFYDEIGWREADGGGFDDALKFEDLRPVSQRYVRNCHLRLATHLPARGTYLLDAASGPLQYDEYLSYSQHYDFRICADVSVVALRHARRKLGEKGLYLLCDVTSLPLKNGVVDGFVSLHTLYHLPPRAQARAVGELYRVLKESGKGAIVYSWGHRSALMNAALAVGKLVGAEGASETGKLGAFGRAYEQTGLFGHSHDFAWYLKHVERRYRARLASWRSVSVPFLRTFIHARAFGRPLLALWYRLESWFPRWFGRYGQYPVFVLSKQVRRRRAVRARA